MKRHFCLVLPAFWFSLCLAGCGGGTSASGRQDRRRPGRGRHQGQPGQAQPGGPETRRGPKDCAINSENRLGSMDVPIKIMVKDQPVFLCCPGCKKKALADPERTLAKVAELKAAADQDATPPAKPEKSTKVSVLRVPERGLQPQAAVDAQGTVHLIYFHGEPGAGDIFYVHSEKGSDQFSKPLQVNSGRGSAIAIGNIRGAHLALGKNARVHVAWNGSGKAEPKGKSGASPMLYSRLNDAGTAFEPQRNVIQSAFGLDGGGLVAADADGNVYVAWHAPTPGDRGEGHRCVWVAHSTDEGKTFAAEKRANPEDTGACGCCGLRAFADSKGALHLLYRAARQDVHRDMFLLASTDKADHFQSEKVQDWEVNTCPMSSETFAEGAGRVVGAWETNGQVSFARIDRATGKLSAPVAAPGDTPGRKHPAVAVNHRGETILAWTEGMGWSKGGSLAWQVFDRDGKPTGAKGRADGVPTWSLVTVLARPDGNFTVIY